MLRATSKLVMVVLLSTWLTTSAAAQEIRIGWTAWSDAEFVTMLTKRILEKHLDVQVETNQMGVAFQYQGIAEGDIDLMLMSWQPNTHADYIEKTCTEIVNLGLLYTDARLGWVVPDYIPEGQLSSIKDLKSDKVRKRLDGRITGIDAGAGLTRLSKKTIEAYGLEDYELQLSSGAGMTAALARAIQREEWIVVTGWSPHWKFGAYDLRYLEDPKGALGGAERVHAVARKGFYQEHMEIARIIARIQIPIDDLQEAMYTARETSYEKAVDQYIANNQARIDYWLTGDL